MSETDDLPDDLNELARQAATGDQRTLEELFNRPTFLKMVDIQCRKVWRSNWWGNGARDREDLKQATFVCILSGISQFKGESTCPDGGQSVNPLAAWIYTIARNLHLKEAQREKRGRDLLEKFISILSPALFEPTPEMSAALNKAYEGLDPDEGELLEMRLKGFKPKEITKIIFPSQWNTWDEAGRTNEAKKMSKRVNKIYEKFMVALGIQSPSPKPEKIQPPGLNSMPSPKPKKIAKAQRQRRTTLNRLRSFRKASGR